MSDLLLIEQIGAVRRLTLNRPEKRNALNQQLLLELFDAVEFAADDAATSVVVIRGAGRCFSAGFDMSSAGTSPPSVPADDRLTYRGALNMNRLWHCPIPIIAQLHGWCLATATDIAFSCDLVIAARDAQIGHPGVRAQGTPPTNMWLYHAGPQLAKWLMLTGRYISGAEAAERGLVLSAHDAADLDSVVLDAARQISLVSRDISMVNKAVLNFGIDLMGRSELQRFASAQDAIGHASPDNIAFRARVGQVGVAAAVAERDARFRDGTGRESSV
ncbi:enoyl-CoA hydratase-related protein [Mycobacterium marseillense]|uniref:enoyl-CoA hydratase-related protein n=1 Tax=Mycobacterium marseillense TaxID=701042 RepID=UPI0011A975B8|nr:enoyl-CoA hydratase-related protein [Mycobacterium marseillense]